MIWIIGLLGIFIIVMSLLSETELILTVILVVYVFFTIGFLVYLKGQSTILQNSTSNKSPASASASNEVDVDALQSDLLRLKAKLDQMYEINRLARIGGWKVDIVKNLASFTTLAKQVLEVDIDESLGVEGLVERFVEGEDREAFAKAVNDAMSLGFSWDLELKINTSKGNTRWVRVIGNPVLKDGKCVSLHGTLQNIDKRKIAELSVLEERNLLQTVIDNVPVNIYVKDLQSRKVLVNQKELTQMGMKRLDEVLGKSDHELFPKESADISRAEDLKIIETGEPMVNEQTTLKLKDGTEVKYLTSKIPIRRLDGQITGILGVSVDVTDRQA